MLAGRESGRQALLRTGMSNLTDRILDYQLRNSHCYLQQFKEQLQQQNTTIDRRRVYQLVFDDTNNSRYGKKVYGSSYQYNHSTSSVEWGQVLVDMVLITDHVLQVDYRLYIPWDYLQRTNGELAIFNTKIETVKEMFLTKSHWLKHQGVAPNKIWATVD